MKITKKSFLFSLFLFIFLFTLFSNFLIVQPVRADDSLWEAQTGMGNVGKAFGESGQPNDIRVVVARIVNIFLGFMGIIMVVLFVWAGYKWMTSQGNEEVVREAKAQIRTAVIGIAIILMAYSIAAYVTQCLYKIVDGRVSDIICR